MPNLTDITGLAGAACAITAAFMLLPGVAGLSKPRLALAAGAVAIIMLTPFAGLPPAAYVRGMVGDLSITTLALLLCAILRPLAGRTPLDARTRRALQMLIALGALALYPMSLGIGLTDPYRLGYGDVWFIGGLLMVALAAWFRRSPLIATCIASAVLAWAVGWYESNNLWDYLLDPLVSIYAASALLRHGMRALRKRLRGCPSEAQPKQPRLTYPPTRD